MPMMASAFVLYGLAYAYRCATPCLRTPPPQLCLRRSISSVAAVCVCVCDQPAQEPERMGAQRGRLSHGEWRGRGRGVRPHRAFVADPQHTFRMADGVPHMRYQSCRSGRRCRWSDTAACGPSVHSLGCPRPGGSVTRVVSRLSTSTADAGSPHRTDAPRAPLRLYWLLLDSCAVSRSDASRSGMWRTLPPSRDAASHGHHREPAFARRV